MGDHTGMLLADVAAASREIATASARNDKIALLARLFAAAEPAEVPVVVSYLAGQVPQRRTGVGWRTLADRPPPAAVPTLTVAQADAAVARIAAVRGKGAQAERKRLLRELLSAATEEEQGFVQRLLTGELRQGALDAFAVEGLAEAVGASADQVRRAVMFGGSLGAVARALLERGAGALADFRLRVGRPVLPMLAQSAGDVTEALERLGPCAVEEKLDGIRVQVHVDGEEVRIFTRTLEDITDRLPEVAEEVREFGPVQRAVLDGEVVALDDSGRPRPFQEVSQRVGSRVDVPTARASLPATVRFFDVLSVDDRDLVDRSVRERHAALAELVPARLRVRRLELADAGPAAQEEARRFAARILREGGEGVVVKQLDSRYGAGRRGAAWLKAKPVHTLDLVVLAAEWGHGRRTGWLSNLHLGARRPDGSFAMLGKTFKGLTDRLLAWQTERLEELAVGREPWGVTVRPELVVEIALDGLQRSTRYPAGVTLRFARVVRYRPDKTAEDADTVADVLALER